MKNISKNFLSNFLQSSFIYKSIFISTYLSMDNCHMSQVSNIPFFISRFLKILNNIYECVGVVLSKQWQQGNTKFSKTINDLFNRGLFFDFTLFLKFSICYRNQVLDKYRFIQKFFLHFILIVYRKILNLTHSSNLKSLHFPHDVSY